MPVQKCCGEHVCSLKRILRYLFVCCEPKLDLLNVVLVTGIQAGVQIKSFVALALRTVGLRSSCYNFGSLCYAVVTTADLDPCTGSEKVLMLHWSHFHDLALVCYLSAK